MPLRKTPLYAATYLMEIGYGLFLLVASAIGTDVIKRPVLLGLTGTVHVSTRILGNVAFGRLSDRIGRKPLMLLACVLFLLAFVILRLTTTGAIFLAYFLAGAANAIFWPLIEAWFGSGEDGAGLIGFLGAFGATFTLGIATGSLLGGFFAGLAARLTTIVGCVLLLAVGALVAWTRDEPPGAPGLRAAGAPAGHSRARRFMLIGWTANFATWTTVGIIRFLFTKLCKGLGIPLSFIGGINAVLYGAWAIGFLFLIRFRGWTYRLAPLALFQGLGAAAVSLIWLRPSLGMFFPAFALFGASAGMTYLSSMFYGQDGAADRGNKSGFHEMVLGLGMLCGPFIGGSLAELFELRTPFLFAALVILLAIGLECCLVRQAEARADRDT